MDDLGKVFFSPEGRMRRKDFWLAWIVLFAAGWLLNLAPPFGWILSLVGIWCSVCIHTKRLHDMGRSGWLQLIQYVTWTVFTLFAVSVGAAAAVSAIIAGDDPAATFAALAGAGAVVLAFLLALLITLAFLLWVGLTPGQPGENRYGPPPPRPRG